MVAQLSSDEAVSGATQVVYAISRKESVVGKQTRG